MLLTFILVTISFIIFRAENIGQAWEFIRSLIDPSFFSVPDASGLTGSFFAICIMIVAEWIQRNKAHALDLCEVKTGIIRYAIYLTILFISFTLGGHAENFIYFQF
jgi:hypothetical protein